MEKTVELEGVEYTQNEDGSFLQEGQPVEDEDLQAKLTEAITQAPQGEEGVEEINGVKYTRDNEGNYLRDGVPVMDSKQVSFYNRSREQQRKSGDAENAKAEAMRLEQELEQMRASREDSQNDDDDDVATQAQIRKVEKKYEKAMRDMENRLYSVTADTKLQQEKTSLRANPKYKSFFGNSEYSAELDNILNSLSSDVALRTPGIVEQGMKMVIGNHYDEIVRDAQKQAKQSAAQSRQIVGEIELGKSGGKAGKTSAPVTQEAKEFAKVAGISPELAAETLKKRKERQKKNRGQ